MNNLTEQFLVMNCYELNGNFHFSLIHIGSIKKRFFLQPKISKNDLRGLLFYVYKLYSYFIWN